MTTETVGTMRLARHEGGSTRSVVAVAALSAAGVVAAAMRGSLPLVILGHLLVLTAIAGTTVAVVRDVRRRVRTAAYTLATTQAREAVGRDVHDLVGRTLTLVMLKTEVARGLIDADPDEARRHLAELEAAARSAIADVRRIATGECRTSLSAELADARRLLGDAGARCVVTGRAGRLGRDLDEALGWVLREAVTNVVRHSNVTTCVIRFSARRGGLRMTVVNDGAMRPTTARPGSGIAGVEQRVAALGGRVGGQWLPGGRFMLTVEVPAGRGDTAPATTTAVLAGAGVAA